MLLRDYAITPDVFDQTCYEHPSTCDAELRSLKDVLLNEGLVRDLRSGAWHELFRTNQRFWHRRGRELVKKLIQQKRMIMTREARDETPADDRDWCREALAAHQVKPMNGGIIVTADTQAAFPAEPLVARIDRLGSAPWWAKRSPSVRLNRTIQDYLAHLDLVLRHANSLMFIDPHLDPAKPRYRGFARLLEAAGGRDPAPSIEVHRVAYEGSGPNRRLPRGENQNYFKNRFERSLRSVVRDSSLRLSVFVWDEFHDRYLISDLIGIQIPNGFDTSRSPRNRTTWTRLGREQRDDVQREFDPASRRHELVEQFEIA